MDLIARTPWLTNNTAVQKLANLTSMWTNLHDDGGDDGFDGARDVGTVGGKIETVGSGGGAAGGDFVDVGGSSGGGGLKEMDDDMFDDEFE